jgi:hypothetical protein
MKKILLLLTASTVLFSCSKVGENEYLITGNAKGIADGQTIILEKQDENGMGFIPLDTVKVENGKFEMKGKTTEPEFRLLNVQGKEGKVPLILENGEINVVVDKDSLHKSKISGTYSNDEFSKFNIEIIKNQKESQKKMMAFQTANMQQMEAAQKNKDTAAIAQLMKQYQAIQKEGTAFYITYAETHPKSFISVLILQGMLNAPDTDVKKAEKMYNSLDASLKNTKPGKAIKAKLGQVNAPVASVASGVGSN